jgi:hypothetical protein
MEPESFIAPGRLEITDRGLEVFAKNRFGYKKGKFVKTDMCIARFSFNGTCIQASERPNWMDTPIDTLQIHMICKECAKQPINGRGRLGDITIDELWNIQPINRRGRLGDITIDELWNIQHYYSFSLQQVGRNSYSVLPGAEEIRYHDNDKFYHLGVSLGDKHAKGSIGSCDRKQTLGAVLDTMIVLNIPQFNYEKIQTLEQYVDKMRMYCLMS